MPQQQRSFFEQVKLAIFRYRILTGSYAFTKEEKVLFDTTLVILTLLFIYFLVTKISGALISA